MIISESSHIIYAISVNYEAYKLTPNNAMILRSRYCADTNGKAVLLLRDDIYAGKGLSIYITVFNSVWFQVRKYSFLY
jgi:hypothetical protein